MQRDFRR
eukprot:s3632_g1.t1